VKVFSLHITCNTNDPVTCPLAASYRRFLKKILDSLTLMEELQGLQSGRFYLVSGMVGVGGNQILGFAVRFYCGDINQI
jgi:hypothetical protein